MSDPAIRNISDTAIWAAIYRARENDRPNAVFRDPYAERLGGERLKQVAAAMRHQDKHEWAWIARTFMFDRFLQQRIAAGADMVINLAAGLDARPYRMDLPPDLRWIEADLPELIAYKERALAGETPTCALERVAIDLSSGPARRELFERLGREANNAVVITEGLIVYLTREEAHLFGCDLAAQASFRSWIVDVMSPGLLKMLHKQVGRQLEAAAAPLQFAPQEGPAFFSSCGWRVAAVHSTLRAGAEIDRLPNLLFRFFAKLPESKKPAGNRPWSAAVLLENERARPRTD
jgi:methyltransferase (TIGR00027 family)